MPVGVTRPDRTWHLTFPQQLAISSLTYPLACSALSNSFHPETRGWKMGTFRKHNVLWQETQRADFTQMTEKGETYSARMPSSRWGLAEHWEKMPSCVVITHILSAILNHQKGLKGFVLQFGNGHLHHPRSFRINTRHCLKLIWGPVSLRWRSTTSCQQGRQYYKQALLPGSYLTK